MNYVDRAYLEEELKIQYEAATTDDFVEECLTRSQSKINYLLDRLITNQASFDALTPDEQTHIKNAIGYLADYWITNGIYKAGQSISGASGALSYSVSDAKSPNFIPNLVRQELSMSGLYDEIVSIPHGSPEDKELAITGINDRGDVEISSGRQRIVTHGEFDTLVDNKFDKFKIDHNLAETSNEVIAQEPDNEGGANQHEINVINKNKVQNLNNDGRVLHDPAAPKDIATKQYVDTHPSIGPGEKGETGETGAQGPRGFTGNNGEKGDQGERGIEGAKGDVGRTGDTGPQGDQGIQGIQGVQGEQGDQGDQGEKGEGGGGGLFFRTQDDPVGTTSQYKQAQEHDGHDDNYYHFFEPQDIETKPFSVSTEETFGAGNKKKYWIKFSKIGTYTLSGHSVLKFASQSELRYYFLHVHEHSRVVGEEGLGEVEHKIEREVSIQISREFGEINWSIAVDITEDNIDQEFVWSLKAETKKERGVRSSDPELRINDIDITAFDSRSYMFLMPTFEGFSGPQGEKGEKGDAGATGATGADGTGLTPDERQELTDLATGSAAEQVKVSKLQNIVGSYGDEAVRPTLVSKVATNEDTLTTINTNLNTLKGRVHTIEQEEGGGAGLTEEQTTKVDSIPEGGLPTIRNTDYAGVARFSSQPVPTNRQDEIVTGRRLNEFFTSFFFSMSSLYQERLYIPDGGTANTEGAYQKPANYLDGGEYYIFRQNQIGTGNSYWQSGAGRGITQTFNTGKTRNWLAFYTPGDYIVQIRVRVKYASALAQGRRSYMKVIEHLRIGKNTEGTGNLVVKSKVFTHRDHANLTDEIRTDFHVKISKDTAAFTATHRPAGIAGTTTYRDSYTVRLFTWSLKFESEVAADGSDVQTEVVEEFERNSSQYMSVRLASHPYNSLNWALTS